MRAVLLGFEDVANGGESGAPREASQAATSWVKANWPFRPSMANVENGSVFFVIACRSAA